MKLISTGIKWLDEILDGGIYRGNSIIIEGPPGSGKTIFGLQFIYQGNKPAIYISSKETEKTIVNYGKSFKWKLAGAIKQKKLFVISDYEKVLKSILSFKGSYLEKIIHDKGVRNIVIDDINKLFEVFKDDISPHSISVFLKISD
ncbi:MAG: hypothetical protein A2452_11325 [Candidatus Firestonebacteria bacterium RIFOXYC2_FULL_39_67]|nr:MAG: hypothetical protein A2536_10035 [Candidatus Firestonebacteria bacterium RIFOXYD2_FULL_39_29]OGF54537.1 MAG: hypothetical protein A2452_11325 [Candidatus Firestonebacteria bacterium RIFOXYC2_FULL_39_67]OGF57936.1 MAG: hypothetical protein A2497_04770 [Candidatus Firestonebacteria bacterium RifOxyC12_full_39_7]